MTVKRPSPMWIRLYLCLLFALSLGLAFPPLQLGFFAYWAFIPLFYLFESCSSKQALIWGYLAGFIWNLFVLYWIYVATIVGLIGVLLVLPLFVMIYGWFHVILREKLGRKSIFFMPAIWVAIEYFRSLGSPGFPWTALAYTQTFYTDLIQHAELFGVFGVSFWVLWINIILFILMKERPPIKKAFALIGVLIGLFLIPYVYGKLTIPKSENFENNFRVALIQGNIDPYLKWSEGFVDSNIAIYDSLTNAVYSEDVDLVVWPETATAVFVRNKPKVLKKLYELTNRLNVPILTGSPDFRYLGNGNYETYNSVVLFQPGDEEFQTYNKMILVPFGERVPLEDTFEFLNEFLEKFNMGAGDFTPGKKLDVINVNFNQTIMKIGCLICYESVFPGHVRKLVKMGAQLLVIVTNDGWYGNSSGPYQHAQIAVFRAIENRTSIARCANTGISSFIDPYGRILEKSKYNEIYYSAIDLPLRNEFTIYTIYGDFFALLMVGVSGVATVLAFTRRGIFV